jgi:hypothetical protein
MQPGSLAGRALQLWWQEMVALLLLNVAWLLLQLPVITGPPATAAVYAISQRIYNREMWSFGEAAALLRTLFWPAWRWAALNGLVILVIAVNFTSFGTETGAIWVLLRLVWAVFLLFWLGLNFYYWPFWLAQKDQSIKTTYGNCARFFLLHPWTAATLVILAVGITAASVLITLPVGLALICWLALLGTTAVQTSLVSQQE